MKFLTMKFGILYLICSLPLLNCFNPYHYHSYDKAEEAEKIVSNLIEMYKKTNLSLLAKQMKQVSPVIETAHSVGQASPFINIPKQESENLKMMKQLKQQVNLNNRMFFNRIWTKLLSKND